MTTGLDVSTLAALDSYQGLSVRTLRDQGTDRNRLHCVLGMAGEAGEVEELRDTETEFQDGVVGELGDCLWYASTFALQYGWPLSQVVREGASVAFSRQFYGARGLHIYSSQLIELWKKLEFYPVVPETQEVYRLLCNYVDCIVDMCEHSDISLVEVAYKNLNKLQHDKLGRYKSGLFTEAEAVSRNYLNESEASGTKIV